MTWFFYELPLLLLGPLIVAILVLAMLAGARVSRARNRAAGSDRGKDFGEHVLTSTMGLLALLLGFTFSLAIDRYDSRRQLVVQEANAIGTTYLRAQLLDEPYRGAFNRMLPAYTQVRLRLGTADAGPERVRLGELSDLYQLRLWEITDAAIRPIRDLEVAGSFVETMNQMIDLAAERKAARRGNVPLEVLTVLLVYLILVAIVYGYTSSKDRRWAGAVFMLALFTSSYLLVLDLDRPTGGGITESQAAMEDQLAAMQVPPR